MHAMLQTAFFTLLKPVSVYCCAAAPCKTLAMTSDDDHIMLWQVFCFAFDKLGIRRPAWPWLCSTVSSMGMETLSVRLFLQCRKWGIMLHWRLLTVSGQHLHYYLSAGSQVPSVLTAPYRLGLQLSFNLTECCTQTI